jgi:hypothetical protein
LQLRKCSVRSKPLQQHVHPVFFKTTSTSQNDASVFSTRSLERFASFVLAMWKHLRIYMVVAVITQVAQVCTSMHKCQILGRQWKWQRKWEWKTRAENQALLSLCWGHPKLSELRFSKPKQVSSFRRPDRPSQDL